MALSTPRSFCLCAALTRTLKIIRSHLDVRAKLFIQFVSKLRMPKELGSKGTKVGQEFHRQPSVTPASPLAGGTFTPITSSHSIGNASPRRPQAELYGDNSLVIDGDR